MVRLTEEYTTLGHVATCPSFYVFYMDARGDLVWVRMFCDTP